MINAFINMLPLFACKKSEWFNAKTLTTILRGMGWLYVAYFIILGATEMVNRFGVIGLTLIGLKITGVFAVSGVLVIGAMFVKDELDYRQRERNLEEAEKMHREALEDTRRISARKIRHAQALARQTKEAEALKLGLRADDFITHGDLLERFAKADPNDSMAFFRTMEKFHNEV